MSVDAVLGGRGAIAWVDHVNLARCRPCLLHAQGAHPAAAVLLVGRQRWLRYEALAWEHCYVLLWSPPGVAAGDQVQCLCSNCWANQQNAWAKYVLLILLVPVSSGMMGVSNKHVLCERSCEGASNARVARCLAAKRALLKLDDVIIAKQAEKQAEAAAAKPAAEH